MSCWQRLCIHTNVVCIAESTSVRTTAVSHRRALRRCGELWGVTGRPAAPRCRPLQGGAPRPREDVSVPPQEDRPGLRLWLRVQRPGRASTRILPQCTAPQRPALAAAGCLKPVQVTGTCPPGCDGSGPSYVQDVVRPITPARPARSATADRLASPSLWVSKTWIVFFPGSTNGASSPLSSRYVPALGP
jgi:hypothetical protein